jgi:hypothetical protein
MNTNDRLTTTRRAGILIPAILGWALFCYWWMRVAFESTAASATVAVALLTMIAVATFYGTLLWIQHNIKLARRGKRGYSTRYVRPSFERDWLDRTLVFPEPALAREGTWFVVQVDENEKQYAHQRLIVNARPLAELT